MISNLKNKFLLDWILDLIFKIDLIQSKLNANIFVHILTISLMFIFLFFIY